MYSFEFLLNYVKNIVIYIALLLSLVTCDVVQLTKENVDSVLSSNEIVFVNFYADWCHFSQMLKPIFSEASDNFKNFTAGKVVWASVDSDLQAEIAQKYNINKYPTLKLFRGGELVKKEYRSQRSVEALSKFIFKQMEETLISIHSNADLVLDKKKRNVVAYFTSDTGPEYTNFKKLTSLIRDECVFWAGIGENFQQETAMGNKLTFYPMEERDSIEYTGGMANYIFFKEWLYDKCVPLVREITFENAEELTEEGLPFLILFRTHGDSASETIFTDTVIRELADLKTSINCLIADGEKFAHPLHHLGKSKADLPVVAIDSFRHMYIFNQNLGTPGALRTFVQDLHSGKLHREFHHGPDPTVQAATNDKASKIQKPEITQPPTSVFNKLKPSEIRYSLLNRDEL